MSRQETGTEKPDKVLRVCFCAGSRARVVLASKHGGKPKDLIVKKTGRNEWQDQFGNKHHLVLA